MADMISIKRPPALAHPGRPLTPPQSADHLSLAASAALAPVTCGLVRGLRRKSIAGCNPSGLVWRVRRTLPPPWGWNHGSRADVEGVSGRAAQQSRQPLYDPLLTIKLDSRVCRLARV